MDINADLNEVPTQNLTLVESNLYQHIYVKENPDEALSFTVDNNLVKLKELPSMGEIPINIILNTTKDNTVQERCEDQVIYSFREGDTVINSNATEDESMAVEALRQLGNSTIHTKVPQDLSLLICSSCNAQFQTTSSFQNHVKICKEEQLKCNVCNEVFGHAVDFNNHIIGHTVARPHSCRLCSTLFINEKDLEGHMQIHATVNTKITNQCGVCGIVFQRPSSLTNHMKIHTYLPGRNLVNAIPTQHADINISEEINAKNAVSTLNWEDYNGFKTEELYANLEVAQEMTIGNLEEDKLFPVEYDEIDLKVVERDELVVSCDLITNSDRPYTCKFCKRGFAREKALISHYKLHSNVLEKYLCCKNCDEHLTDEVSLNKHQLNCKIKESVNNSVQEENAKDVVLVCRSRTKFYKHACLKCDKRFSTKQKLHRHMWIHRRKTFSCEICACLFEKREELDAHRLSTHQANSAYVCHECGKSFTSRQGLWEHNRLHGDGSQLYKCTECLKTFSSRQGYLIHKRTHNDERPYGCRFCWKSFRDGGTMRKHERIHTGERPHVCPLCNRAFNQKVVLREHVRCLHVGTQPPNEDETYDCNLCDQKLTDRDELCAHIVKHSDQLASLAKEAAKNGTDAAKVETNKIKRKLTSKVDNKVVIEILPTADTANRLLDQKALFECDLCGDGFFTGSDLAEHIRIHI